MILSRIFSFGFHGDYLSDRIVRVFSVLLYLIIAINMWAELKRDDITVCWTPANFTSFQAAYVNKVCQTEANVFPINIGSLPVTEETKKSAKENNMINFRKMRCLPLVIVGQTMLFLVPWLLWRSFSDNVCSLDAFIRESQRTQLNPGDETSSACLAYLSSKLVVHPVGCKFGRGYFLYMVYICKRVLYVMVCLLQMMIFSTVLGINFFTYGRRRSVWEPHSSMKTIVDYPYGIKGEAKSFNVSVRTYPSEVNCEFKVQTETGIIDHMFQCSVPPADTLEMSLGLIWIWLIFLMVLAVFSFIHHLIKFSIWASPCMQAYKRGYLSSYMSHHASFKHSSSQNIIHKFVTLYMKPDIYFVANMTELNGSLTAAMAVFEGLWEAFEKTCKISKDDGENSIIEETSSLTHKPSAII